MGEGIELSRYRNIRDTLKGLTLPGDLYEDTSIYDLPEEASALAGGAASVIESPGLSDSSWET